ncbi:hypothetical protein GCM10023310_70430 [Paenibacillus vulneris]|uniref:Uncharacterized protein n=1 Tax=Paenibacillus vulneris TaxID=1133364 RepID=A0ABW3UGS3_9BACL
MNIVEFAENELKLKLTYFQQDLLQLLQSDPDSWFNSMRFDTLEMRQIRDVFLKWQESMLVGV